MAVTGLHTGHPVGHSGGHSNGQGDAFSPGKLLPGVHGRLVDELDRIALEAGITPQDITGENYALTDLERDYLRTFRRSGFTGKLGIIYVGRHDPSVIDRGRSICGALIRNFITARFIPREELVDRLFSASSGSSGGGSISAECVVVPDFHYGDAPLSTRRALASWLIGRIVRGGQTILGVPTGKVFGEVFPDDTQAYLAHFHVTKGIMAPTGS